MPWLTLPSSAEVPRADGALPADVRQDLRLAILSCERSLAVTATSVASRTDSLEPGAIGPEEIRNGWRKFFLGHHAFIYAYALLADFYRQQAAVCEGAERPSPEVETICALWRLAGAFMAYGVDFPATEAIYRLSIRPSMPEAFSGTWLREYVFLAAQRRRFDRALDAGAELHPAAVRKVRDRLAEAEKCYHNLHFQVMLTCVPDLVSKLQDYQATHGKLTFGERHFARFDEWFHVVRSPGVTLPHYIRSLCAVFSAVLADLQAGTALTAEVLGLLTAGVAAVCASLRRSIGEEA